jgi:hypothetical protein
MTKFCGALESEESSSYYQNSVMKLFGKIADDISKYVDLALVFIAL